MPAHFSNPLATTYSIVARDPLTGQLGAAVQSHWFSVGSVVPWVEAGVGSICTQSVAEVSYGPLALDLLRGGKTAQQALDALLLSDEQRELRQVAVIDANGSVAVHTGSRCIAEAGHVRGESFSVQANMMMKDTVWQAMAAAYQKSLQDPNLDLAERMLQALEAAELEGGDIRGKQSAAIKIGGAAYTGRKWAGVLMDLRVEDHPLPIPELRRLVSIHKAYEFMNQGDEALGKGEKAAALKAYHAAAELAPMIVEIPFWNALTLSENGQTEDALALFREVFTKEPVWAELVKRLPKTGLMKDDPELLAKILAQVPS